MNITLNRASMRVSPKKKNFTQLIIAVLVLALIASIGILVVKTLKKPAQPEIPVITVTPTQTQTPEPTPTPISYNETAPSGYEGFFEKVPVVGGQQAYVGYPLVVDPQNPPQIVIYYHGSSQKITTNFSDDVMKNVRYMASEFTKANYVFVASNQHGDNYGSATAVQDSVQVITWVKEQYPTQEKVMVLGFSMGGMPAMRHVLLQSSTVEKVALLAPATQVENYKAADFQKYTSIPVKVWHGTKDVNVPYWVSTELLSYFEKNGLAITRITLDGKTHFQIDTEYTADIITYFNE